MRWSPEMVNKTGHLTAICCAYLNRMKDLMREDIHITPAHGI